MSERSVPCSLGMFWKDKYISCCLDIVALLSHARWQASSWLGGRCRILSLARASREQPSLGPHFCLTFFQVVYEFWKFIRESYFITIESPDGT